VTQRFCWTRPGHQPRREVQVELRNRGTFDELVVDNWLHLEQMRDNVWWMQLGPIYVTLERDGTSEIRMHIDYLSKSVEVLHGRRLRIPIIRRQTTDKMPQ